MGKQVMVAKTSDIPEGSVRVYEVGDVRLAISRVEGTFYAIDDICTHDDGPLGEGKLDGFEIQCPRHGARFDVRDGHVTRMPAAVGVNSYPTQVEGDEIYVEIEEE